MAKSYCVETVKTLRDQIARAELKRPMRVTHYEDGDELTYQVQSVGQQADGEVRLRIDRFVGGGFAGQVYRVEILAIKTEDEALDGLAVGQFYAMKILIPPSNFSLVFRDTLYWIGFQGPFQLQVNPVAARAGALWQKFIRRGAGIRFGDDGAVVDIHATFVDDTLGSCGELSEWLEGRTWQLEVDDRLDRLKNWRRGKAIDEAQLGSVEYRAKHTFMTDFVTLLHDMGGHEFARQYEWSTCKSQPNCLKRYDAEGDPKKGLTAVDFRAGLVLLPFLPMSPGDFKLIGKGIARRSLVQFDRGDLGKLRAFVQQHQEAFTDMTPLLDELEVSEDIYRNSVPDITHNHVRLLFSAKLWRTLMESTVQGWRVRNLLDDASETVLAGSRLRTLAFASVGAIGRAGKVLALVGLLLTLLVLGQGLTGSEGLSWSALGATVFVLVDGVILSAVCRVGRKIAGRADWRAHYGALVTQRDYFKKALQAKATEKVIEWHRAGRVNAEKAQRLSGLGPFLFHLCLSFLPAGVHRMVTDGAYARERLVYIFIRPFQLYFNAQKRREWMEQMLVEGQNKHMLTDEDAQTITAQLDEPYIQKYLVSLVVHLMTLPVTQIVSIAHMAIWNAMNPDAEPTQRTAMSLFILTIYQIIPLSPGSFCRGLYTTIMAIRDRNFKDYNIALFLSYFKYVGYLAFPIQMTYHYPALARFMAGHWATEAVHVVPVFGERGALLEHWVFNLFYNWPLTLRGRLGRRAAQRAPLKPRYWHMGLCVLAGACLLGLADKWGLSRWEALPTLGQIWWAILGTAALCGSVVTWSAGGASLGKRIIGAACTGLVIGLTYTGVTQWIAASSGVVFDNIVVTAIWRLFSLTVLTTIAALVTEILLPDTER